MTGHGYESQMLSPATAVVKEYFQGLNSLLKSDGGAVSTVGLSAWRTQGRRCTDGFLRYESIFRGLNVLSLS